MGGDVTSAALPGNGNPATIDCGSHGGPCFTNVDKPSTVLLTGAPTAGYVFQRWGGACSGTATTCRVSVTVAKAVAPAFLLPITISSVTPSLFHSGEAAKILLTGVGFLSGATFRVSATGVTVPSARVAAGKLKAVLSVGATAGVGPRDLIVTNPNGQMGICTGCLTIYTPTIIEFAPSSVAVGASRLPVALVGTAFDSGAKVTVSGSGVKVKAAFLNAGQPP